MKPQCSGQSTDAAPLPPGRSSGLGSPVYNGGDDPGLSGHCEGPAATQLTLHDPWSLAGVL